MRLGVSVAHDRAGLGAGELPLSKHSFENGQARRAKAHRSSRKRACKKDFYFKCALKRLSKCFGVGDNGRTQLIVVKDGLDDCTDNGEIAMQC